MKKAHAQCFIKSAVPQLKRRGTADFLYGMFTINNTKNTADYEAESLPIISGMLIYSVHRFRRLSAFVASRVPTLWKI